MCEIFFCRNILANRHSSTLVFSCWHLEEEETSKKLFMTLFEMVA